MFDAEQFCFDYSIDFAKRGHHHYRRGWINIECPFCTGSHQGYHLGININYAYSSCYRCGWHFLPKTVSAITKESFGRAKAIIVKYSHGETREEYKPKTASKLEFPAEFKKLMPIHWSYLKSRKFKPSVARTWELLGSGIYGKYSHRIIAPIYLDGILISYQGRDITGKSKLRYKACEQEDEVHPHQNSIYGIDLIKGSRIGIVEGITDAWRLGPGFGATFGIEWTNPQARMIASRFKQFLIIYDSEEQAQEKASSLYQYLTGRGLEGEIVTLNIDGDAGDLTDKQAHEIRKDLGL